MPRGRPPKNKNILTNFTSNKEQIDNAVESMLFAISEAKRSHFIADEIFEKTKKANFASKEELEKINFQMKIEIMKIKDRDQITNGVKNMFFILEIQKLLKERTKQSPPSS